MTSGRIASLSARSASPYVVAVLSTELAIHAVGTLELNGPFVPTFPLAMVIYVVGMATALVCWVAYRAPLAGPVAFRVFLALAFALWFYAVLRRMLQGTGLPPDSFTIALLVILMWTKPPRTGDGRLVLDGLAWSFIVVCAAALVFEVSGFMYSWHGQVPEMPAFTAWERSVYWMPLAEPLGLAGRWGGPFPHPNQVGPVGSYLVVVAMCRRGIPQWVFLTSGFVILILSASRTSTLAALVAAGVVSGAMVWRRGVRSLASRGWSVVVAPLGLISLLVTSALHGARQSAGIGEFVASNESLMGRTDVWRTYLSLWQESPLVGVSEGRIADAVSEGIIPGWASHSAHNLVVDALARTGIVGLLLLSVCLLVVAALGLGAARRGEPASLGLLAVVVTCAVTEALVYWDVIAAMTVILLAAAIAGLDGSESGLSQSTATVHPTGPGEGNEEPQSGARQGEENDGDDGANHGARQHLRVRGPRVASVLKNSRAMSACATLDPWVGSGHVCATPPSVIPSPT